MNKIWLIAIGWVLMAGAIIYWDYSRWESPEPISVCHNAPVNTHHERPMCTECKLYCETK